MKHLVQSILIVFLILFILVGPALAQDTGAGNTEPAGLAALGLMAGAVVYGVEQVKTYLLKPLQDRLNWTMDAYNAAAVFTSLVLALALMFAGPNPPTIFSITNTYPGLDPLIGKIVTALLVGLGNGVLHAAYDILRDKSGQRL